MENLGTSHILEIVIILAVILRQFQVSYNLRLKIFRLKDLNLQDTLVAKIRYPLDSLLNFDYSYFKNSIKDSIEGIEFDYDQEDIQILSSVLLHSDVDIGDTQKIIRELNTYMLKNEQHMINFNIIRDIVDRNYQVLDDEINQSLPTPLYLGLAATMLGIIFGLWGMFPFDTANIGSLIAPLITGVAIAMISSFLGVALTTFLTTILYRKAKKEAEEEKNQFFSQLQSELLPELLRKGETGVEELNRNLDRFARVSSKSIGELSSIAQASSETLRLQSELMKRVDNLNVRKISKSSLEIFERLENNLENFDKFSNYWERLTQSLSSTNDLAGKLHSLIDKFKNIDSISAVINNTLNDYNNTMGFFTAHIEEIKKGGDMSKLAVTQSDIAFKEAIEQLTINTTERIQNLNESSSYIDVELKGIGEDVAKRLKEATETHIEKLTDAYVNNTPEFEKLRQLDSLPQIYKAIEENSAQIANSNYSDNEKLIKTFDLLEQAINKLSENMIYSNSHSGIRKPKIVKLESILKISAAAVVIVCGIAGSVYIILSF